MDEKANADCSHITAEYKRLAFDYAAEVRLPLANHSLPQYGAIWTYQDIQMVKLKDELFGFLYRAKNTYEDRGIAAYPGPFDATPGTVIVDLIAALEALNHDLDLRSA